MRPGIADGCEARESSLLRLLHDVVREWARGETPEGAVNGETYASSPPAERTNQPQHDAALLAAQCRLLELVAMGEPLHSMLGALCLAVESLEAGAICSVLLVDESGERLAHGAAPSLPPEYMQEIDGALLVDQEGPCAAAVLLKRPVIVSDFVGDSRWSHTYLDLVLRHGLRAGWSAPMVARSGAVLGAFAIYFRLPGEPSPRQYHLIERFTHVASIAIERANAETELRRSEAHLAMAQRLSATGSFTWTLETGDVEWSDEVFRIYGMEPGNRPSLALARERVHPDDRDAFSRVVEAATRDRGELDFGHRLLLPGGVVRYLHIMATPVIDRDGGPTRYFGAVRDVTERQRADEALSRARSELAHVSRLATLGELTASIAHEVNQPLAGIVMNADASQRFLTEPQPDVGRTREAVQRIRRDAQRAAEVIVRLRALFRGETTDRQLLDVNEAIGDVLSLSLHEVRRARVTLRTNLAPEIPAVVGDRVQLQQVVLNLVMNALESLAKETGEPRTMTVATQPTGDGHVRISVHDNGAGIAATDLDRIFDAFYTTKRGGMGMGLSIARTIVESHGSRLLVESRPGDGAMFAFTI